MYLITHPGRKKGRELPQDKVTTSLNNTASRQGLSQSNLPACPRLITKEEIRGKLQVGGQRFR